MIFRILSFLCLTAALLHAQDIPESWDVTIEVNQLDPNAKDNDPTTPFKTINAAAQNALGFARAGRTVLVRIYPGIYRENVRLIGKPAEDYAMIKLEGTAPGKVVLNGCELVGGWKVNDDNHFEHAWTREKEGIAAGPGGPILVNPTVFIEGARMVEVDSPDLVTLGKIYFGNGKVYLIPPKGGVVSDSTVEISRPLEAGIYSENIDSLFIESLSVERGFKHGIEGNGGVLIINNVSIEYIRTWGLVVGAEFLRMRRVFVERCGWGGAMVGGGELTITGTEVNLNGWAIDPKKLTYENEIDFAFGIQFMACDKLKVWSLRTAENNGMGLWLDGDVGEASLGKITAVNNQCGILVRSNKGKVSISESEIAFNELGMQINGTVTALVNVLYGNKRQVHLRNGGNLTRNVIVAEEGQGLVRIEGEGEFTAQQNLYYAPSKTPFVLDGDSLTFAQWQEQTGQDLNSYFGDPLLLDPKNYSFTPKPGSPWFKMKDWPVRELN